MQIARLQRIALISVAHTGGRRVQILRPTSARCCREYERQTRVLHRVRLSALGRAPKRWTVAYPVRWRWDRRQKTARSARAQWCQYLHRRHAKTAPVFYISTFLLFVEAHGILL